MSTKASSSSPSLSRSSSPPPSKDVNNENESVEQQSASRSGSPEESTLDAPSKPAPATVDDEETASASGPPDSEEGQKTSLPVASNAHVNGDWQAVWSAPHNMYYFHNLRTGETTWTNPLANADADASSSSAAGPSSHYDALAAAAAAQGIDPALAHLDPSLAAGSSNPAAFTYTAKFNARTGQFAKPDARNPEHVSEYERMKRMSNFYFDMDAWQQEVEERHVEEAESGKKRKNPTKKDIELFKERKKQKKLAKTAWLRT